MLTLLVAGEILGCHGYDGKQKGLTSVPTDIPAGAALVALNNNKITNLTFGVFSRLYRCEKLLLYSNFISLIEPGAFTGLTVLEHLDLKDNHISQPIESTMWAGLQYLDYLGLHQNYITNISAGAFSGLIWLKTLHLYHNYLTKIDGRIWERLKSLEWISLAKNRINGLQHHSFSNLPSLKVLGLASNQLNTLRSDVFNPDDYPDYNGRPRHLELYLSDNPLECNMTLFWLKEAVTSGSFILATDTPAIPTCANLNNVALRDFILNCTGKCHYFLLILVISSRCVGLISSLESERNLYVAFYLHLATQIIFPVK